MTLGQLYAELVEKHAGLKKHLVLHLKIVE